MSPLRAVLTCLVLAGAGTAPVGAALTWVSTSYTGETKPLQKILRVAFSFKNTGDRPVVIRAVQTNCDCLAATTDRAVYQPGEAGLLGAQFTVGDRVGAYERSIVVATDDGTPPQRLRVHIDVPEIATVTPRMSEWSPGSPTNEQAVDLTVAAGIQVKFEEIFVSAATFRARFETVEDGRRYRIFIQPVSTAEAASAAIRLKGQSATGDVVVVSAYANVR